jgi:thioesterase domain-containing protein
MGETGIDPNLLPLRAVVSSPTHPRAEPPLFLVAAPGVNALGYVALARRLPEGQPVYVVQPRRRGRTFPPEGIGPGFRDEYPLIAAEYLASIRTVQRAGPYFLGGMCDGALIAFHMTRLLEAEGERVALLAVVDTWPLENTAIYPLVMLKLWRRGWGARSSAERRALLWRKAVAVLDRGVAVLRRPDSAEPRPRPPRPAVSRQAVWRARLWPGSGFQPAVIQAPITVLRVPEQPFWRPHDDALGWRARTRGAVTVHVLPGNHVSWARAPNVERFSITLGAYLGGALEEAASPEPEVVPNRVLGSADYLPEPWGRLLDAVKERAGSLDALFSWAP